MIVRVPARYVVLSLVSAVVAIGSAAAQSASPALDTARLRRVVEEEMRATRTPGAAVAVVVDGRLAYAEGFGVTSVEEGSAVGASTLFRIGSVTKVFTGLSALLMARDGALDLDAPIGRYATGLHPRLAALTLRDLLHHTAGLASEAAASGPHDDAALGARVRNWGTERLFATAGDVYSYSGPGYWLAGYALEQHAKGWYADLVSKRVLEPLGMRRSTFRPTVAMTFPLALDHRVEANGPVVLRPYPDDASTWPSGALFSSVTELSRLAMAVMDSGRLDGTQVMPREAVAALHAMQTPTPGSDCGYSFGLSVCSRAGVRTLSHYGFRVGSGAVFTLVPDRRIAVIILANRNGGIFGTSESAVLGMLIPALQDSAPGETAIAGQSERSRGSSSATGGARVVGRYVSGGDTLHLEVRDGVLRYRYGIDVSRAVVRADTIDILDESGSTVQQFFLVRGRRTSAVYLHDGLNAFRRVP